MIDIEELAKGDKVTVAVLRRVRETGRPLIANRPGLRHVVFMPFEGGDLLEEPEAATEAARTVLEAWGFYPDRQRFHDRRMGLWEFAQDPEKTLRHVLDEHAPALTLTEDRGGAPMGIAVAIAVSPADLEDFTMAHAPEFREAMDEADMVAGLGFSMPWADVRAELIDRPESASESAG